MTAIPSARAFLPLGDVLREPRADDQGQHAATLFEDGIEVPEVLGGVKINRLIGEGGMGRVYLGHHAILDLDVAVKVLHKRFGDRARFLSEARLAAKIQHHNIVRIHNAGVEHGFRFLVMEHVAGQTLKQYLKKRGPLPWREAAGFICQAAHGLAAAHRRAIIHRDVKLSNMLLDTTGGIKVADLGLARYMIDMQPGTISGQILGTPHYMAPEQAREASSVTPAADVYSLGVSLFCLLTGKEPFGGTCATDILLAHRTHPIPDPRVLVPDLPPPLAALTMQMLAKEPGQRPADGAAVVAQLEQFLDKVASTTTHTRMPAAARSGLTQRWLVGAGSAAAVALMLAGWSMLAGAPTEADQQAAAPIAPRPALAAIQAPPVADPWQTPARAVFALTDRLPAAALAELDATCLASGLPVVERQRIDALVREQDLVASGHADPATAGRIGRLVGGHIALFASAIEDRIEVRTVLVETGELVASRLVAPGEVGAAVSAGLTSALALLPVQGRVTSEAGKLSVSAGIRHGLRVGDRLELRRADGSVLTSATVTAVERERATISVVPMRDDCGGALAVRAAAP